MAVIHGEAATRAALDTHIGRLFRGSTCSSVSAAGKPISSTMQPFTTVQLTLRGGRDTLADALKRFFEPETLDDYEVAKGRRVQATKRVQFHDLPQVRASAHVAQMTCAGTMRCDQSRTGCDCGVCRLDAQRQHKASSVRLAEDALNRAQ